MPKPHKPQISEIEYVPITPAPEPLEQLLELIASLRDFVPTQYVSQTPKKTRRDLCARVNAG